MPKWFMDDRATIVREIAALQRRLQQIDRKQSRARRTVERWPARLAQAPRRHIALLFSYHGWEHSGLSFQPMGMQTSPRLAPVENCLLHALVEARLIAPLPERSERSEGREDSQGSGPSNKGTEDDTIHKRSESVGDAELVVGDDTGHSNGTRLPHSGGQPITHGDFGCGFERCGRTDAGVSSSAQVVNLWVRSNLTEEALEAELAREAASRAEGGEKAMSEAISGPLVTSAHTSSPNTPPTSPEAKLELPYVKLLNQHLPPSIRILAWSPVSDDFSSRFSCIWRHYKYFFSLSPSDHLRPRFKGVDFGHLDLDLDLMNDALERLKGTHDFRNFCRIDPMKQLPSHIRSVSEGWIEHLEGDMYEINIKGGAFLYNQVRHLVALLFLVGSRLEPPEVVDSLLWTSDRTPTTIQKQQERGYTPPEVMDRKPAYEMADDLPLVLYECGFNSSDLQWRLDSDAVDNFRRQYLEMAETYTQSKLKSIILQHHLKSFVDHNPLPRPSEEDTLVMIPNGAGRSTKTHKYTPLLSRQRGLLPEEINQRWAEGRGAKRIAEREKNKEKSDAQRVINLEKKRVALEKAAATNASVIGTVGMAGAESPEKRGNSA